MLAILGATTLMLAVGATTASPQEQIVIQGADSGSHLKITTKDDRVLVNGYMTADVPVGCHFLDFRTAAICPTSGTNSIRIEMGSSNDKVEILDPMPVPVIVYLGDGSDKFIGNNEVDTCYPQGSRRNRCYGGGGDDVCITGARNSDCVGDGGDDYAKFSTGSDGCWGDYSVGGDDPNPAGDDPRQGPPGNDICIMGPGKDGAHGGPGSDQLYEGSGQGKLYGGGGRDYCDGGPGVGRTYTCESGPGH